MELIIIGLLPISSKSRCRYQSESVIKYFLIQICSGILFLQSALSLWDLSWLFTVRLVLKLGLAPLHVWVVHIYSGLSCSFMFLVSTIIKVPGVLLIEMAPYALHQFLLFRVVIGRVGAVFMSAFKKLIAYSRVANTGWIGLIASVSDLWIVYFLIYSIVLACVLYMMSELMFTSIRQIITPPSKEQRVYWGLLVLSLGGMPPLLGFSIKWVAITSISSFLGWLIVPLGFVLSMRVYYYIQMCFIIALTLSNNLLNNYRRPAMSLIVSLNVWGGVVVMCRI